MTDQQLSCPRCAGPRIVAEHTAVVVQPVELDRHGELRYLAWRSDDVHLDEERFLCVDCEFASVSWQEFLAQPTT